MMRQMAGHVHSCWVSMPAMVRLGGASSELIYQPLLHLAFLLLSAVYPF